MTTRNEARAEEVPVQTTPSTAGAPASGRIALPDRKIELHEMPDITKEAPEVEYGQPKRTWLRVLAVGLAGATIGVAAGVGIGAAVFGPTESTTQVLFTNGYSAPREHLAQAPGGFGSTLAGYPSTYSAAREHLAQAPGGFGFVTADLTSEYSLAREHAAQAPGGYGNYWHGFPDGYSLAREHLAAAPGGFGTVPTG